MQDFADAFNGAALVTLDIHFFRPPRNPGEILEIAAEFIGQDPKKVDHSGILQSFVWQLKDKSDIEPRSLRSYINARTAFIASTQGMNAQERLNYILSYAANEADKQSLELLVKGCGNSFMPQSYIIEISSEELFKTICPYPKVRDFIRFWDENIEGPLQNVRFSARPLLDQGKALKATTEINPVFH